MGFHIPQAVRAALRTLEDRLQCEMVQLEERLRRDFFVGAAGSSAPPSGTLQRGPVGDVERGALRYEEALEKLKRPIKLQTCKHLVAQIQSTMKNKDRKKKELEPSSAQRPEASESHQEAVEQPGTKQQALSYEDAFVQLGGQEALQDCEQVRNVEPLRWLPKNRSFQGF